MDRNQAETFMQVSEWLGKTRQPPKIAILENSEGICKKGTRCKEALLHSILWGSSDKYGNYGLKYLAQYHVDHFRFDARSQGMPHKRMRV
eukprot:15473291-Alexandrium_andersonii.AAC.1